MGFGLSKGPTGLPPGVSTAQQLAPPSFITGGVPKKLPTVQLLPQNDPQQLAGIGGGTSGL